jgi:hypothetical protein
MPIETDMSFDVKPYITWKAKEGKDYDKLSQDKSLSAEQVKAIALARVAARKEEAFTIRQDQDWALQVVEMINPFDKKDTPGGAPAPIMAPGGAPAPSATDLPQSLEAIESQEKSAILERLKQTTFDFWWNKIGIDPSKITIKKQWENYTFSSSAWWFEFIKTPIEVNKKWELITKEIEFARGLRVWLPKNGIYTLSQEGTTIKIQEKTPQTSVETINTSVKRYTERLKELEWKIQTKNDPKDSTERSRLLDEVAMLRISIIQEFNLWRYWFEQLQNGHPQWNVNSASFDIKLESDGGILIWWDKNGSKFKITKMGKVEKYLTV